MTKQGSIVPQGEERAHSRMQVGIAARLQTLEGPQDVRLVNISQNGAHVLLGKPVPIKQAFLSWLDFEVFGDIVWQKGDKVGMQFDGVLPIRILVETRQRAPFVVQEEALALREWVEGER